MMEFKKSSAIRKAASSPAARFFPICYLLSPPLLIPYTGPLTFLESFSLLVFSEFVCICSHIMAINTV